ncbi:uncharacterized protein LOC114309616 isoform X4 [Camellia sinensis]|uniref:uncharacterized protein LOC114309616 isoform X3 n=1 Tax=Camellia sinensis TaxID=4442 RepID=UPI001035F792|nr:uncharacterized protein LOC114309616 isoform X3 [Camellia sinensis]XP_028111209.1 uncharacterized protein LOC114309616 isoform X4 [Camellia sinensis]
MGDPGGTYERGSVSGNMLIIRPTTAPTSQTNPQDSAKCGYCKKEYQKIYVTVEPEQIPQGRQKRGLVSALKSGIHRFFSCASSPSVA